MDGRTRRRCCSYLRIWRGGPQCGPADARGGACQPGGTFAGSLELLLFPRKVGSVQKIIRECNMPGADPATFTTELDILAVRGFGDMGTGWAGARHRWSPLCPELADLGGGCGLQGENEWRLCSY